MTPHSIVYYSNVSEVLCNILEPYSQCCLHMQTTNCMGGKFNSFGASAAWCVLLHSADHCSPRCPRLMHV